MLTPARTCALLGLGLGVAVTVALAAWESTPVAAPPARGIETAPFVAHGMVEKSIVKEITIEVPPNKVFWAFTTPEGLAAALEVEARIDLRIGGAYELLFGKPFGLPEGQQGSEGCQILSYIPGELLCFTWNAPPSYPQERDRRTWVAMTFTPTNEGAGTHIRLVHVGFGHDGRWPDVQKYFDAAWGNVLQKVKLLLEN
ncbi:MAG: SRPBCC domain-containing protein [Phycisphaeraceae bacterium]|nr:SRPBCC domain-containing protein [Phycisphaeraceae bacterium]MCW5753341.1 SRPBCC domain-containing protein [Phycisphaeraceae bacterium]